MSSAVFSTSAATGRPFVFDEEVEGEVRPQPSGNRASLDRTAEDGCPYISFQSASKNQPSAVGPIGNRKSAIGISLTSASHLEIRPGPEMVSSGIPALDALTGGLPRGCLTEICGPASSGRTTVLLAALAAATRRGEFCAVVDASDALDPRSVDDAGVELNRLLWVRCGEESSPKKLSPRRHRDTEKTFFEINSGKRIGSGSRKYQSVFSINNQKPTIKNTPNRQSETGNRKFSDSASEHRLEQVLRATDLLLESGGFGLIALDLADLPPHAARRIPLTTWFRFRRAVEHTATMLLAIEQQAIAGSCSSLLLQLSVLSSQFSDKEEPGNLTHTQLLTGLEIHTELIRSRLERKPVGSIAFAAKTAWAAG